MGEKKLNESYYEGLHRKVEKYHYTIMSVVSDQAESENHAAYCYTIGLSNYGYPEIMFADCYYDDVITITDLIVEQIASGAPFNKKQVVEIKSGSFKAIELLDGVKEEISAQAAHYFELYRPQRPNYNLIYFGKADQFGLFPDEKIFCESKHIKQIFYKQVLTQGMNHGRTNLVMPESLTMQ